LAVAGFATTTQMDVAVARYVGIEGMVTTTTTTIGSTTTTLGSTTTSTSSTTSTTTPLGAPTTTTTTIPVCTTALDCLGRVKDSIDCAGGLDPKLGSFIDKKLGAASAKLTKAEAKPTKATKFGKQAKILLTAIDHKAGVLAKRKKKP